MPVAFGEGREQVARRHHALNLPEELARTRRASAVSPNLLHQVIVGEDCFLTAASLLRQLINGETGHDVDAACNCAGSDWVVAWLVTWCVSR